MIRVNDKWDIPWHKDMTVADVLAACNFNYHYIAVSINHKLVPPEDQVSQPVGDGDQVLIIHIVSGG